MSTEAASSSAGQPGWLEQLTGVRSSKGTFYAEYSRTSASLNRAIQALEAISSVLCMTTSGPLALAQAVLGAAAGQLGAAWTAMAVAGSILPVAHPLVVARDPGGAFLLGRDGLPSELGELAEAVLGGPPVLPGPRATTRALVAPMALGGTPVGALLALLPHDRPVDDIDVSILQTLANQAVVALRNACLFEESERFRAQAVDLYEQAEQHARALEERNHQLSQARGRLLEAEERHLLHEERSRIARELHDSVAQYLLSIGMMVEWCRPLVEPDSPVHERLGLAKELARAGVEQVRTAIFALASADDPPAGELLAALERLGQGVSRLANLAVVVRVDGMPFALDPRVERALYRIAQEALFNVARHAHASSVSVRIAYEPGRVRLVVRDDGTGDAAMLRARLAEAGRSPVDGHHRGLANMARRAWELGGALRIARVAGGGVVIVVTVPLGRAGAGAWTGPPP